MATEDVRSASTREAKAELDVSEEKSSVDDEKHRDESTLKDSSDVAAADIALAENKKESPFLAGSFTAGGVKKGSPFLSTKKPLPENIIEDDAEKENEVAIARQQHSLIDAMIKDKSIFNAVGKLYFVSPKTGKLETRGEGKIAILKDESGLYKVLMIRDSLMLKGCNHYIAQSCPLTKATQVARSWTWRALNDKSDAELHLREPVTDYFTTFKTEEDSELFSIKYNEALEANAKTLVKLRDGKKNE